MTTDFAKAFNDAQPRPTTGKPVIASPTVSFTDGMEITVTGGNNPYTVSVNGGVGVAEEINGNTNVPVGSKHRAWLPVGTTTYRFAFNIGPSLVYPTT